MEEEEINRKHSQMKQGEWITYGNEIQLMHSDSRGKIKLPTYSVHASYFFYHKWISFIKWIIIDQRFH